MTSNPKGKNNMVLVVTLIIVNMLCGKIKGQSSCNNVLLSMAPCVSYVSGSSTNPSSSCCSQLASVVKTQPQCLCLALNGAAPALGIKLNQTLALSLPNACNVQTPPLNQCNAADGPASATPPVDSPVGSPERLPDGGSKAVPVTGGSSSLGVFTRTPQNLLLLVLIITTYALTFISV